MSIVASMLPWLLTAKQVYDPRSPIEALRNIKVPLITDKCFGSSLGLSFVPLIQWISGTGVPWALQCTRATEPSSIFLSTGLGVNFKLSVTHTKINPNLVYTKKLTSNYNMSRCSFDGRKPSGVDLTDVGPAISGLNGGNLEAAVFGDRMPINQSAVFSPGKR